MSTVQPIYLTFDDGPDPEWTPQILDILAAAHAHATFFVVGRQAQSHPNLIRRIVAEGHELANHTYSHRHPWLLSRREARSEVRRGSMVIDDFTGFKPRYFRPPHGRERRCMREEAESLGARTLLWDVSAIDWGFAGTADRIAHRLEKVSAGEVVLMHDGRNKHNRPDELVRVLPGFLNKLPARGLRPELLRN